MSAFAQHDGGDNIMVSRLAIVEEIGECRFCLAPDPVDDEAEPITALYELIDVNGEAHMACERHWWKAWHNAWHVRIRDGVHTIIAPTPTERAARDAHA